MFTVARNHLINQAKRSRIVSFDVVADLETIDRDIDMFEAERHLDARDSLRQVLAGLEKLSPRVREIVQLRKIDGLTVREKPGADGDTVRLAVSKKLGDEFGINHATVQTEREACEDSEHLHP